MVAIPSNANGYGRTWLTGSLDSVHTGNLTLECLVYVGDRSLLQCLFIHGSRSTSEVALLHGTITYNYYFLKTVVVFGQSNVVLVLTAHLK